MNCTARTEKGKECTHKVQEGDLCKVHTRVRERLGPHAFAKKQLMLSMVTGPVAALDDYFRKQFDEATTPEQRVELQQEYNRQVRVLNALYAGALEDLREKQRIESLATGVDPDAEVRARKAQKAEERAEANRLARQEQLRQAAEAAQRRHEDNVRWAMEAAQRREEHLRQAAEVGRRALERVMQMERQAWDAVEHGEPRERQLRDIVNDSQSVHTTEAVKQTKEIVARVRTIPVPEEYRWSKTVCSKTPGEIIAECHLTPQAAWQMMSQYAHDNAIYGIEEGIYGKTLDCVWQYIKHNAEKESLTAILRRELEDNIGMCAQGNLTRVCNILAGYLEGVGSQESVSERLGRLLPALMEMNDSEERMTRAREILEENAVPRDQWTNWLDALA